MGGVQIIGAASADISRVLVGAGRPQRTILNFIKRSHDCELFVDIMTLYGQKTEKVFDGALDSRTSVNLLLSPIAPSWEVRARPAFSHYVKTGKMNLVDYDAVAAAHGATDSWQHSKLTARVGQGGEEAWWGNVYLAPTAKHDVDVVVKLDGKTEHAAVDVGRSWASGDLVELGRKTDAAAAAGLLINDPAIERTYVSQATDELVSTAHDPLAGIFKGLDDTTTAQGFVDAMQRGERVGVVTGHIARESAEILQNSGVPVLLRRPRYAEPLIERVGNWMRRQHPEPDPELEISTRINFIASGDTGLLSTNYPIHSVLRPENNGRTAGRESALLLHGDALEDVAAKIAKTDEGRAIAFLKEHPGEPLDTYLAKRFEFLDLNKPQTQVVDYIE